jgi:hypothetical protein
MIFDRINRINKIQFSIQTAKYANYANPTLCLANSVLTLSPVS